MTLDTGSLFVCSLTGRPTDHPVVCIKNGLIYDQQAILNYITIDGSNNTNTIQDSTSAADHLGKITTTDIVSIYLSNQPYLRSSNHTTNTETQELKQQLAHALFKYEASLRVIDQLLLERQHSTDTDEEENSQNHS